MKIDPGSIAAALLVALAACAVFEEPQKDPPPPPPEPVVEREPAPPPVAQPKPPSPQVLRMIELDGLLTDFERLRRLNPGELSREQDSARQAFNQTRSDAARIRYAMALAVPGATGAETGALELLDPLVKNPAVPLHGLAFLLAAYIQEQRRLASQVQGLQQNMQGLQQNVQALQQKLDALRTLERSLSERDAVTPKRR
jgi:hypothetical protein